MAFTLTKRRCECSHSEQESHHTNLRSQCAVTPVANVSVAFQTTRDTAFPLQCHTHAQSTGSTQRQVVSRVVQIRPSWQLREKAEVQLVCTHYFVHWPTTSAAVLVVLEVSRSLGPKSAKLSTFCVMRLGVGLALTNCCTRCSVQETLVV